MLFLKYVQSWKVNNTILSKNWVRREIKQFKSMGQIKAILRGTFTALRNLHYLHLNK